MVIDKNRVNSLIDFMAVYGVDANRVLQQALETTQEAIAALEMKQSGKHSGPHYCNGECFMIEVSLLEYQELVDRILYYEVIEAEEKQVEKELLELLNN